MAQNIPLVVFPVKDLEKAKTFYGKFLDTEPYVDGAYYVGYKAGNMEIGLDPNSTYGPIIYTDVKDIKASIQEILSVWGEILQDAMEVGGGLWIAKIKDMDGNVVGLRQVS